MSTSSLKLQTVEVESFDILELYEKSPSELMEYLQQGKEIHLCIAHRDLHSHVRLAMVTKVSGVIVKSILMYAQVVDRPDYGTLIMINEGVTGYLEESINVFKNRPKTDYVQMDIRLMVVKTPNQPMSLNTKTSFIKTDGNYESINR